MAKSKPRARRDREPETVLVLRPPGRGNWEPVLLRLSGRRAPPPLLFTEGQHVELAGQTFRVAGIATG